ncbi:M14 family zinc carboxypeptidase [Streptomyces sp. LE64]|uniref:M14 family zinc carboxypeptidase n=1 Tax=Streptomyces sp. LE64 TaxID=3448653 RepID=UPI004040F2EF
MGQLTEQRYPTVADLVSTARWATERWPSTAALRRIGTSRGGRPIHLLSVGHARRAVLVVAGAHANEPAGGATVRHLVQRTVEDRELRADTSWHFVLCADPDGAALHDAPAPRTLVEYHRGFFRPAGPEQPEWAPSLVPPGRTPPETRALESAIDRVRPYLQVSLHSTELGGSWVQLTRDVPGLAEPFAKSAAELHVPLEADPVDATGWPAAGPGVHVMPAAGPTVAFPSMPDEARVSTWHHVHRYGGLTAVVEVPMWASDVVGDCTPHPAPGRELRALAERLRADARVVAAFFEETADRLPPVDDALLRAARWALALAPQLADDWSRPQPDATTAYLRSVEAFGRRLPLRAAAMLLRVLEDRGDPAVPRLERVVARWCDAFAERFRARWVPVEHQVEHQARTVLAAAGRARPGR